MNTNDILFSVIIPHRNSLHFLPKLISSIPDDKRVQVLLVDNSPEPVTKQQLADAGIVRTIELLYSDPSRGAGGARNVGIDNANGKWLIFADADDYFSDKAFDTFFLFADSKAELVYTCMGGIYLDTGEHSDRGDGYTNLVRGYLNGTKTEMDLRLRFASPCCKMVSSELIKRYNIRYDEVPASNDMYFSMLSGFYARRIDATDSVTYIATVSRGSLTKQRNLRVIESRFRVYLRCNKFLKENDLGAYQNSVMYYLTCSISFGLNHFLRFIYLLIKYKQNPFINCGNWITSLKKLKGSEKKDANYITK